ncbi:MAG TPA: hypothetical protein VMF14_21735 [Solirubrobacteraceae bacterium]|nr:hypothetical protein [Solirubrobacteraceae bacterium]
MQARLNINQRIALGLPAIVFVWGPAILMTFLALYANGLRCDDACDPSAPGWHNNPGAWQWSAQLWGLAVPALIAATMTLVFLIEGRGRRAAISTAVAVVLAVVWLIAPAL